MYPFSAPWFQTMAFLATTLIVSASATAEGERINLEFRPQVSEVQVGDVVEIGLYAVSDGDQEKCFAAADIILNWDPKVLRLLGLINNGPYNWLLSDFPNDSQIDGVNDTWEDGDALYTALANFQEFPCGPLPPDGLLMTSFQWEALVLSCGTEITIAPTVGEFTVTQILDDVVPGRDITGTLGSATVIVSEAVLPESFRVVRGLRTSGTVEDLQQSDDSHMVIQTGAFAPAPGPQVILEVDGTSSFDVEPPCRLRFLFEGHVVSTSPTPIQQQTFFFNYDTQAFDLLDTRRAARDSDDVFEIVVDTNPERYVEAGTGKVKARMEFQTLGLSGFLHFDHFDQTIWTIAP